MQREEAKVFFKGSRYFAVEDTELVQGNEVIRYKKVRFIPPTPAAYSHVVRSHERLDHIAFEHFRDPEQFWRICDANLAMWPGVLVEHPGDRILIPPPEG